MFLLIFNIFFCIAFIGFAWVNLNDNDAWLWVSIYGIPAVFCGLAVFNKYFPPVYLAIALFCFCYAIRIFFAKDGVKDWIQKYNAPSLVESMKANKPYIEKAREFFGLLIVVAVVLVNYFVTR
ncbi:transmembrane 220 family protein [Niabella pedocola]|uniref:Transmembrane 220 family protein n=1 Tax=Niabella pedocola TaxID=1752077 RepID=A0ABS8PMZ2_9BACT|nr:transmembrane 220 family protein [Niabella pedocola]MCD2422482.1 transmembrane 220 family protein [Niabella pedocola]